MYPVIAGDNGLGASGADRFALRVDQVDGPRHFYISTPKGRSARMTLEPSSAPLFDKVVVSYDFPGYTGWPDAVTGLSTQGLRALEGTRVSLHIQSNTGLGGGELVVTTGDDGDLNGGETYVVTPDPTNPKIAEAVFWPDESGRFALSLIGEDGAHGAETLEGVVTVLPDRAPKVEIDYPPRQSVVPEGWPVEAQVTAGDDIGLGELLLHTSVNETPAAGIPLNKSYRGADETVADGRYTIDPARLEAKAGDTLEVFASVSDNHPRSPFTAESPVHRVHVITMRQYLDLARQRYRAEDIGLEFATVLERLEALQAQRDQLLQELAELREVVAGDAPMSEADGQRLTEITEELQDYQASASGLADHLQARAEQHTLYAFEESYKAGLRELAGQLQGQAGRADALADALQSLDSPDAHAGALRMAEAFALAQPPFDDASSDKAERTEQDLTRLRLAQAVLAAGERIRQVAFKQDELAVHMSAVQCSAGDEAPTGPRLAALAERQAELRAELEDATNTLRQASEAASALLPRLSGGALAVAHQIEQRRIVSTQSAAERAALNGQGGLAFQAASAAADQLDALLSDVGQNTTQAASDLDGFFNLPRDSLQSALSQMAAGPGLPGLGRQGGSGSGMQGSAGRVTMIGPSVPGLNGRPRAAGRGLPGGQGEPSLGEGDGQGVAVSHEIITTDAGNNDMQGSISLPGVPAEYRDQAEAYFKRLAEEQ